MNKIFKFDQVNFNDIVKNNPGILSDNLQTKLVNILRNDFTSNEQHWYIANLYMYMLYHPTRDYPINLEDIYKMLGFANKGNAMKSIKSNFIKDEDYKIIVFPTEKNKLETRGRKEETIMLNVDTFKNLCMLVKTEQGKNIRKYYVKLENIYNGLIKEELENHKTELIETKQQLEIKTRLAVKKWSSEGPGDVIYGAKSNKYETDPLITIGQTKDVCKRESGYFTCNPQADMFYIRRCYNCELAEKVIHHILDKYREESNKEWFSISENLAKYTIDLVCDFLDNFINCSERLPELGIKEFLDTLPIIKPEFNVEKTIKYRNNIVNNKTDGKFHGVSYCPKNEKWKVCLYSGKEHRFLGYYDTDIEAAITYNDYASFVNNTSHIKYILNNIENYTPNPRDLYTEKVNERNNKKFEKKTSKYIGVYYVVSRQYFECSITYKKKHYKFFRHKDELECAKKYNEEALYFNNNLGTKLTLNNIPDFVTVERNHIQFDAEKVKRYSRFTGVTIRRDSNKFRAYIKFNRKTINLGTWKTEEEAAVAYNTKAEEFNKLPGTTIKYTLNDLNN